jgi:predicted phosphodiesterase
VRIAVIGDVHGNRWALEAVLEDLAGRAVDRLIDVGDSVYGPLDPAGTARILIGRGVASVRGNQDRIVLAPATEHDPPTLRFTRSCLSEVHRQWLASLPETSVPVPGLYCCHGTPHDDDEYLLEAVSGTGVRLRSADDLSVALRGVREPLVLCGHSHLPRVVTLPGGPVVVNPGSVGLQAFSEDAPVPHAIETGSPHARYAIVEGGDGDWRVVHVAVSYDWEAASRTAEHNGRSDWAEWLRTGRAEVGG